MRIESSIVPGAGSFRLKLVLLIVTGVIAFFVSRLTGLSWSLVWYFAAIFAGLALFLAWPISELSKDYKSRRH